MIRLCAAAVASFIISALILNVPVPSEAQSAHDPGPRAESSGAGKSLNNLTGPQTNLFNAGLDEFKKHDVVEADGLGRRMNLDRCASCHAHPDVGGTSPPDLNPQFDFFENNLQDATTATLHHQDRPDTRSEVQAEPRGKDPGRRRPFNIHHYRNCARGRAPSAAAQFF